MDYESAQSVAEVLKAVAHPVRLQIVVALEQKALCVADIMASTSAHAGISTCRACGQWVGAPRRRARMYPRRPRSVDRTISMHGFHGAQ